MSSVDEAGPGRVAWVTTGDRGIWWRSPFEDRTELVDADLGSYLLGTLLNQVRVSTPVVAEIHPLDPTSIVAFVARLGHVFDHVNHRLGTVTFQWYAADDALVMVDEPPHRVWCIALRRSTVDRVVPPEWAHSVAWVSLDGIYEPETDYVVSHRDGNLRPDATPTHEDLRVGGWQPTRARRRPASGRGLKWAGLDRDRQRQPAAAATAAAASTSP